MTYGFTAALARRFAGLLQTLDRQAESAPTGPRSPGFRAVFALVSTAVLLTVLHFGVMGGPYQLAVTRGMLRLAASVPDPRLSRTLVGLTPLYPSLAWAVGCVAIYLVVPVLIVKGIFREPLTRFGASPRGFVRHLPVYLLLLAPVLVAVAAASATPAFQQTYPFYRHPRGPGDLLLWEAFYLMQFAALEFFFRGFLVHSLFRRLGSTAVFVMAVPYCMIHFQKPFAEALAAIVAGVVLGVLSLRTGNIWGGVFIHVVVALTMDGLALWQRGWF